MAIRMSPLMGLGAIAQGYEQQRQEAARRQLIEEQLRAQALSRAAQGAIGATLTAPGGIGAGVGSSPYAGLGNLGGGGAGGGDPINAPPPGSAPNVSYDSGDSYGNAPKSNATSGSDSLMAPSMQDRVMEVWRNMAQAQGNTPDPTNDFPSNTDQGFVPRSFPQQPAQQPQGSFIDNILRGLSTGFSGVATGGLTGGMPGASMGQQGLISPAAAAMPPQPQGQFRNVSPQAANAPATLTPQPAGGYGPGAAGIYVPPGGNQAVNIQGGQPVNPAAGLPPPPAGAAPMTSRIGGGSYARQPVLQPQAPLGGPMPGVPPQRLPPGSPTSDILPAGGRQPAAGQQQSGGQQQQFNPMDLLNPAKSLDFASQIAMRIKAANPNASNEVIAMATTDLMKSLATQDRLGTALAIAQMKNVTSTGNLDERIRHDVHTENVASGGLEERQRHNVQTEGTAAGNLTERQRHNQATEQATNQRFEATQQRWARMDAAKEQARQDALAKGNRTGYMKYLQTYLASVQKELSASYEPPLSKKEAEAATAKVKELQEEMARVGGQTRPQ